MNPKLKVIVLIIAILISLSLAGTGLYLFQREHIKNIQLEEKLEELSAKQKASEAKFLEAQKVLATLESKFKEAAERIDTLNSQIDTLNSQIDTLNTQVGQEKASKDEAVAKIEQMRSELEQQKELRTSLEARFSKSQDDVSNILSKLKTMKSEKETLELKVKKLEAKSHVELGKIVVSPETVQVASLKEEKDKKITEPVSSAKEVPGIKQGIEGKVLVLNKEYNFAVVNLGSKDGIVIGDQFAVYHGDKYVGDVKVEKVQESMSAAGFVEEDIKNKVKEGDKVLKKVK